MVSAANNAYMLFYKRNLTISSEASFVIEKKISSAFTSFLPANLIEQYQISINCISIQSTSIVKANSLIKSDSFSSFTFLSSVNNKPEILNQKSSSQLSASKITSWKNLNIKSTNSQLSLSSSISSSTFKFSETVISQKKAGDLNLETKSLALHAKWHEKLAQFDKYDKEFQMSVSRFLFCSHSS